MNEWMGGWMDRSGGWSVLCCMVIQSHWYFKNVLYVREREGKHTFSRFIPVQRENILLVDKYIKGKPIYIKWETL